MADKKSKNKEELEKIIDNTKVVKIDVEQELRKSFIAYAMAVNISRAIPDVRDGLKPVHRRILFSMSEQNLFSDRPTCKSARIVGDVLGKYHPHGDSAVYDAMVRLAQDFSIRYPLIFGQGNFGSVDGDPAAAYRYTEARLSKIASEMLRDIDKETVDFDPNFDNTCKEPHVLPSRIPNLLVNGSDGIAVGMATNIPPHNLGEVIDGIFALIDNPDIDVDELLNYIPAPDFPTGGVIVGRNAIRQAYKTGRGSIVLRAKTEIEEIDNGSGKNRIIITELPYQVNKARLIQQMANLVKDKRIEGISDIKEESDRHGMRIVVDVKKDAQPQVVLNMLFKHTQLQTSDGIIFLALVGREPKILNLKEMLYYYLEHQKDVIVRRTRFDLEKTKERQHVIQGLVLALANIDEVIKIIKQSSDRQDAMAKLMGNFELSDKQAGAILDMKLQRLTSLEVEKLQAELDALDKLVAELNSILADPAKVLQIIKDELTEIKEKYGDARKTEISLDSNEIDIGDLIDKEDVVISLTHQGYVKRLPVAEYKSQHRGGKGVTGHKPKEEDFIENMFVASTHDDLLFFTSAGKVYALKGYEIPEFEKTARGRAIINILPLASGEKVNAVIAVKEGDGGCLIMATKGGLIKKTDVSEFDKIRKVGKIAIKLTEGDELIAVHYAKGDDEIIVATKEGKCVRFSEKDVRATARDTQGVKAIEMNDGDEMVDMLVIDHEAQILTISENGYGKRSGLKDYRLQNRGGKGVKAGVFNEKTGKLASLKQVRIDEDIMLIADNGIVIRIGADEISEIGRDTQGVSIMKLESGKIATVAITAREPELPEDELGEGEEVEQNTAETNIETPEASEETTEV